MLSTVYHKKAFVLKIPLHPPLPKGDNQDCSHIFMRFLPTYLREDPKKEALKVERLRGFRSFMEPSVSSENDSTVIHFALDSPFRVEQPSDLKEIPGVKIDSLIDIATNKVLALFGRAELRDFIDVYFLIKEGYTKDELIEKSAQKDSGFDLYWLGVAMERINEYSEDSPNLHLLTVPVQ